jgi:PAS domain S-box-containing protein
MARIRSSIFDLASFLVLAFGLIAAYTTFIRLENIELEENIQQLQRESQEIRESIRTNIIRKTGYLHIAQSMIAKEKSDNWQATLSGIYGKPIGVEQPQDHEITFIALTAGDNPENSICRGSEIVHLYALKPNQRSIDVHPYLNTNLCALPVLRKHLLAQLNPDVAGMIPASAFKVLYKRSSVPQNDAIFLVLPVYVSGDDKAYNAHSLKGWVMLRATLKNLAQHSNTGALQRSEALFYEITHNGKLVLADSTLDHTLSKTTNSYPPYYAVRVAAQQTTQTNKNSLSDNLGKHHPHPATLGRLQKYRIYQSYAGDVLYRYDGLLFYESENNFAGSRYLMQNWKKIETTLYPSITTIGIALISLIISFIFMLQSRTRARAEEIAVFITQKLRDNEDRFRAASEGSNDGIWDWNIQENSVWFSKRYCQILGYEEGEIKPSAETFQSLIHPDDLPIMRNAIRAHFKEKQSYNILLRMRHKNGEYRWIRTRGQARFENGVAIRMAGVHTDVTEDKQREIELAEARNNAEEATRAKADFLANMSHEIRTPLNGIMGIVALLDTSELPDKIKQYFAILKSSSQSLLDIVNDILDFSKLNAGQMKLEMIAFDLHVLVHDMIELMRPNTSNKPGLEIHYDYAENLPRSFVSDPTRIRQIILNLLSNAIKFTSQGYVRCDVRGAPINSNEWALSIRVEDTGIGIAKDKIDTVFNKFTQADSSTTRQFGGTGLGLSIVREITKLLGGEISVTSALGKGTKFELQLRLKTSAPAPEKNTLQKHESHLINAKPTMTKCILIAEDNPTNQYVIAMTIEKLGWNYVIVGDGQQAIDILNARTDFDAVLMDCQMPVMDGYQATHAIRMRNDAYAHIPIIALTANTHPEDRQKCLESGMNDYLTKPVNIGELKKILMQFLEDSVLKNHAPYTSNTSKNTAILDAQRILSLTSDSPDRIAKFLTIFTQTFHTHSAGIKEAIAENDAAKLKLHAHTLKGAAMNLYALELQNIALEIEMAHKNPESMSGSVTKLLPDLDAAFERFSETLRALIATL